jgi:osmoprotectant transport system permease protein
MLPNQLDYLTENWREVLDLAVEHLQLSGLAMAVALAVAIPLGIAATRFQRLTLPLLSFLGAVYTVPSLAFLAFLIPVPGLGLGRNSALVVLAAYAQIFLVRNLVAGLRGVAPSALEAARGLGMTPVQVFLRVRWPLALPVILAGIRTASVTTIRLATITAWVGAGGLGQLLFEGVARLYAAEMWAGAIAITALALLVDATLRLAGRFTAVARATRG